MPKTVVFAPLIEERRDALSEFSCGDRDLDSFLVEDSLRLEREHVTRTMLAVDDDSGEILGYVAVLNDAIRLLSKERKRYRIRTAEWRIIRNLGTA